MSTAEQSALAQSAEIAALRVEIDELRRTNSELEQFAYAASHDLREPLRMIGSYAALLARRNQGVLDQDSEAFIGFILDGARRLDGMIADLLEFSRVGRCVCSMTEQADCGEALMRALDDLASIITETRARICIGEIPAVTCDLVNMERVFANLIGNALKYRIADRVPVVAVSAETIEGGVLFSIADNGPGIPENDRSRIFNAFTRLHGRDVPGTGLGLAISRKIVECHHGRLWVEDSQDGPGSVFRFTVKTRPADQGGETPSVT